MNLGNKYRGSHFVYQCSVFILGTSTVIHNSPASVSWLTKKVWLAAFSNQWIFSRSGSQPLHRRLTIAEKSLPYQGAAHVVDRATTPTLQREGHPFTYLLDAFLSSAATDNLRPLRSI